MSSLLKVAHWQIKNAQAQQARFIALTEFSATAKSSLNNKRAKTRQNYHILIAI